jgi:reelin
MEDVIRTVLMRVSFWSTEGVSHEESWSFYPNAVRTAGFCGNPSFHLYWPNKNQDHTHNILATRELIVQPGYILQFKVRSSRIIETQSTFT